MVITRQRGVNLRVWSCQQDWDPPYTIGSDERKYSKWDAGSGNEEAIMTVGRRVMAGGQKKVRVRVAQCKSASNLSAPQSPSGLGRSFVVVIRPPSEVVVNAGRCPESEAEAVLMDAPRLEHQLRVGLRQKWRLRRGGGSYKGNGKGKFDGRRVGDGSGREGGRDARGDGGGRKQDVRQVRADYGGCRQIPAYGILTAVDVLIRSRDGLYKFSFTVLSEFWPSANHLKAN
ncbi:hypothetical protein B0H19DRAFT_1079938 [Mycena capillaripes]|nr:hypothetical protein B0H19DRAFT_1079938 [Mycena capillaripes]